MAVLRDKMDQNMYTPEDVARRASIPIIGTVTNSRSLKPAAFVEQIAGDYQTIRTNLGLSNGEGMPRRLAVTSPGMREGKTTFAINLATSMAKSGKKVLLVDGDLRKPDVGQMLGVSNGIGGLQDVLAGQDPEQVIRSVPSSGLDVLPADRSQVANAYELLVSPIAATVLDRLSDRYDHVIVDTPPVLIFPDALVWSGMTDAVVLVSFAGQTTATELKEAKGRLVKVKARVLGTVLSGVRVGQSLYSSAYAGYHQRYARSLRRSALVRKKLLLPVEENVSEKQS